MAEFVCPITVNRGGKNITIQSNELVPSDLVILDEKMVTDGDMQIPCDMVLINGQCVVNESNLTGESIPVVKAPISNSSNDVYVHQSDAAKKHTLFSGSKLMQVRSGSSAIVTKIGYQTTKGQLIREILYSKIYD